MSAEPGHSLLQNLSPEQVLRLNHRAGEWYVRRQQPGWSGADERALSEWLAQDPAHREALDGVGRTWREAEQLKAMLPTAYGHVRPMAAPRAATQSTASVPQGWSLRPALASVFATALFAVLATGYGWYRWDNTASYTADIATSLGELRDIDLPDGSHVVLNANSRLQVRYFPRRRETVLERGEAFFKVAADAGKPFTVDSSGNQVRVVGTAFSVRAAPPEFVVQVQEGRVEVRSKMHPQAPVLSMGPGTGVAVDPASGHTRGLSVVPEAVAQWRTGQIYFKRAPLRQVADELSRYLDQPVEINGTALQTLPVSGLLALKEPERFLLALPSVIRVSVQRRAEGGWLISPQ
ncbi:FecR family protein [Comamonas composti]|uniref:FecR family protein n=1 Tax=Comamonas composti TaxID=408558 RepID=UPI000686AA1E|nr:FecR domain-containing protein [Comamonas composti]